MCEKASGIYSYDEKAFACGILYAMRWETPTSGGASFESDQHDIDNETGICMQTSTYLRQACSFVALMMKSSHSGLEFWKGKEKDVFIISRRSRNGSL